MQIFFLFAKLELSQELYAGFILKLRKLDLN